MHGKGRGCETRLSRKLPKPEHVSGFVAYLPLRDEFRKELAQISASTRNANSRAERRKVVSATFRALGRNPSVAQSTMTAFWAVIVYVGLRSLLLTCKCFRNSLYAQNERCIAHGHS